MRTNQTEMKKTLGTWQITVAGVALVVAASTMVSDFTGYFTLGWTFAIAIGLGFIVNLLLGLSATELSVAYPKAGALYDYAKEIFKGQFGKSLGIFLGLSFYGMFAFAMSGEVNAGAFGLRALFDSNLDIKIFVVLIAIMGLIPNLFGIKSAAWFSALLLLLMIGIRWFFGIAGFFDLGNTGPWTASNLNPGFDSISFVGEHGLLTVGLALAFWGFVGIEFACSLAEEVKNPKKSMPRGIILGLVLILLTSLVMGLGVAGSLPLDVWNWAANGELGQNGEAPQLAVGQMMFGRIGYFLMALASVAATLGSIIVAFASLPRIIYSSARDGNFFGPLSGYFAKLHPKYGTPVRATLLTFVILLIPALYSSAVVDWVFSAAYVWIILYIVFHSLALANRFLRPNSEKTFTGKWFVPTTVFGIIITVVTLYYSFADGHAHYGSRALIVLGLAALAAGITFISNYKAETSKKLNLATESATK